MSKIVVVGLGYVGLTTAVGLAKLGHEVAGFDVNLERVQTLAKGRSPIFEPGLEVELESQISSSRLGFYSELAEAAKRGADFYFICVPTPQDVSGSADLSFVESAVRQISKIASTGSILVTKSTVPVGTGAKIVQLLDRADLPVASNPEFLREGTALSDFMNPDRIVVGSESDEVGQKVVQLYKDLECRKILSSLESAELIKYAANSYLATRLSFVNDLAALSGRVGADIEAVIDGVGTDSRIGSSFLRPGPGWGGSCFPKDTRALVSIADAASSPMPIVEAAIKSNDRAFERVAINAESLLGGSLEGKTIAVWGLSFKAETDDVRDSPALEVISRLHDRGAIVRAFDPVARVEESPSLVMCSSAIEAATGSEALIVLTEWRDFAKVSPEAVASVMTGRVVLDTRRVLDLKVWGGLFQTGSAP